MVTINLMQTILEEKETERKNKQCMCTTFSLTVKCNRFINFVHLFAFFWSFRWYWKSTQRQETFLLQEWKACQFLWSKDQVICNVCKRFWMCIAFVKTVTPVLIFVRAFDLPVKHLLDTVLSWDREKLHKCPAFVKCTGNSNHKHQTEREKQAILSNTRLQRG